jgi:uncharacterized membrane protein
MVTVLAFSLIRLFAYSLVAYSLIRLFAGRWSLIAVRCSLPRNSPDRGCE